MAAMLLRDKTNDLIKEIQERIKEPDRILEVKDGKFYMEEKNDYSFFVYFIYNPGVFKEPVVDEIYYDLKERYYKLYRNGKDLNFTEENIRKSFGDLSAEAMSFFEVDTNRGFYQDTRDIGRRDNERNAMFSRQLIRLIEDYPALENMNKAGIPIKKFCNKYNQHQFRDIDFKATNLNKAFGFEYKLQLQLFRKLLKKKIVEPTYYQLLKILKLEDLEFLNKIIVMSEHLNYKYGLDKTKNVIEYLGFTERDWQTYKNAWYYKNSNYNYSCYRDEDLIEPYKKILKREVTDLNRFIEYLFYEADVKQAYDATGWRRNCEYADYIRMMTVISNGHHFDRYPASILTAHSIAVRYYNLITDTANAEAFEKAVAPLKFYEGNIKGSDYIIIAPTCINDIIKEGQDLSHCVKSYIPMISENQTSIVFLRKKDTPEESLYTIEIKDNAIVQAAGWCNCELEKDAKEALSKFAKSFSLDETWSE